MSLIFVLAAIVCWAIAAVTGFGWFGADLEAQQILGWISLGLVFYGVSLLVPWFVDRRRPPA
jgi:hypothetical protein